MAKIAVVQHPPVLLDRDATLARAVELLEEAVAEGAQVVVFPEAFVPGYPTWVWRLRPGGDMALGAEIHGRLAENAVDLGRNHLEPLCQAAAEAGVHVICGVDERDDSHSRTTIFNTAVVIGPDGAIVNRHRKLMPTNPERMVWGFGDASGLKVVDTPCGRLGVLLCWENYMPLARYALYAQGVEVLVSPTWDSGDGWVGSMQFIAREGRCWVVGSGTAIKGEDVPEEFPGRETVFPKRDEWINQGDSVVVEPGGSIAAGPLHGEKGILIADIDPARVVVARRSFDVAGHYSRPDVFQLIVKDGRQQSFVRSGDQNL